MLQVHGIGNREGFGTETVVFYRDKNDRGTGDTL